MLEKGLNKVTKDTPTTAISALELRVARKKYEESEEKREKVAQKGAEKAAERVTALERICQRQMEAWQKIEKSHQTVNFVGRPSPSYGGQAQQGAGRVRQKDRSDGDGGERSSGDGSALHASTTLSRGRSENSGGRGRKRSCSRSGQGGRTRVRTASPHGASRADQSKADLTQRRSGTNRGIQNSAADNAPLVPGKHARRHRRTLHLQGDGLVGESCLRPGREASVGRLLRKRGGQDAVPGCGAGAIRHQVPPCLPHAAQAANVPTTYPLCGGTRVCTFPSARISVCGGVRDVRGIHDRSCTAGGDITARHNAVRDAIHKFACRGRLAPVLERAGLLSDASLLVDLRRPADILIEGALNGQVGVGGPQPLDRLALDVKVINALGASHLEATATDPLAAAEAYHDHALTVQQTAARCAAQGITYAPIVFTAQGGMAKRAEAVLHQIAAKVAEAEGCQPSEAFAQIADDISLLLARHSARAATRRKQTQRITYTSSARNSSLWRAARGLPAARADAEVDASESDEEEHIASACHFQDVRMRDL